MTSNQTELDAFVARFAKRPAAVSLASLVAIEAHGEDAEAFLQGQFSNDVAASDVGGPCQLNAYCNPKGRTLALIQLVRRADGFWLIVPAALAEPLLARLRMFVLRAKVELTPRPEMTLHGVIGDADAGRGIESTMVGGIVPRRILIGERAAIDSFLHARDLDPRRDLPPTRTSDDGGPGDAPWRLLDILSGIPQIHPQTTEQFIPQMINLDLIGAISFTKGCYPGQEIIARLRHRGKVKQRMLAAVADNLPTLAPGTPLRSAQHPDQKAGMVVDAVRTGDRRYAFSATAAVGETECEALLVDSSTDPASDLASNPVLTRIPLPHTQKQQSR